MSRPQPVPPPPKQLISNSFPLSPSALAVPYSYRAVSNQPSLPFPRNSHNTYIIISRLSKWPMARAYVTLAACRTVPRAVTLSCDRRRCAISGSGTATSPASNHRHELNESEADLMQLTLISSFRRKVDEICGLLGCYAASCGNCLPTFRDNVSVPS
jgi:hypothetical protein